MSKIITCSNCKNLLGIKVEQKETVCPGCLSLVDSDGKLSRYLNKMELTFFKTLYNRVE